MLALEAEKNIPKFSLSKQILRQVRNAPSWFVAHTKRLTQNQAANESEQSVRISLGSTHVKLVVSGIVAPHYLHLLRSTFGFSTREGAFISVGMLMPIKSRTVGAMLLMAHPSASSSA